MRLTAKLLYARRGWVLGLVLLPWPSGVATTGPAPSPVAGRITCEAAVQHPIQVRVEALDPVLRGSTIRLRLTSRSQIGLADAEARVVSTGGATLASRPRAGLGRVTPERSASTEFVVNLPTRGERFLIEFRVEGEGPAGRIGRGASLNLLPDGPATPARVVAGEGGRAIAEYPARRIVR